MKIFKLMICIVCISFLCCGCWDKEELEDNTFVVLLGVDMAGDKNVMVTMAFPLTQLGGENQGEGGSGSGEYSVMSIKAPTVFEGLNLLGTKLAGPISLFSIKTLVISQELAENDMLKHVFSTWRYEDVRSTANVLISKCKAAEFVSARVNKPAIDVMRQEELLLEQANDNSYFKPVQLLDLIIRLKSNSTDGVALYGNTISKDEGESEDEDKSNKEESNKKEIDINEPVKKGYLPGEIPIKADNDTQIGGLAVFRGNKMVGVLDSFETQIYSMLTKSNTRKVFTLSDPIKPDDNIVISILPSEIIKIQSRINNNIPEFDIDISLNGSIEGVLSNVDYNDNANHEILVQYVRDYCAKQINSLINKVQKEYGADILMLGNKLARNFLTVGEWNDFNWQEKYKDAKIHINVLLKIER